MAAFYALIPNVTGSARIPRLPESLLKSALIALNLTVKAGTHEKITNDNIQLTQQLAVAQAKAKENYFVIALTVPDVQGDDEILEEQVAIVTAAHKLKQLHLSYKKKGTANLVIKPVYYQITGQLMADGNIHSPWQDAGKLVDKASIMPPAKAQQPISKQTSLNGFSKTDIWLIAALWLLVLSTTTLSIIPYLATLLALSQALTMSLYITATASLCFAMLGQMFIGEVTNAKKNLVVGLVNAIGLSLAGGGLIAAGVLVPVPGLLLAVFTSTLMLPSALIAAAVYGTKLYQLDHTISAEHKLVHEPASVITSSGTLSDSKKLDAAYVEQVAEQVKIVPVTAAGKLQIRTR